MPYKDEKYKQRIKSFAVSEISQRSHRNESIKEDMPKLRDSVEAAERRVRKAKFAVEDAEYNIEVNNEAVDTMQDALVELDSADEDVVDNAYEKILRYTRGNSITVTGDVTKGF